MHEGLDATSAEDEPELPPTVAAALAQYRVPVVRPVKANDCTAPLEVSCFVRVPTVALQKLAVFVSVKAVSLVAIFTRKSKPELTLPVTVKPVAVGKVSNTCEGVVPAQVSVGLERTPSVQP